MTDYVERLRLTLRHDYWGDASPPLEVAPVDPRAFAAQDLLLRRDGDAVVILAPADAGLGKVTVVVSGPDAQVPWLTKGVGLDGLQVQRLKPGQDSWTFGEGHPAKRPRNIGDQATLGLLEITFDDGDRAARHLTVRFESIDVHWAYQVTGGDTQKELEVVTADGAAPFEKPLADTLPTGQPVRIIRSKDPIPMRARPMQRFTLRQPGPFGPQTLIRVLPAPHPHSINSSQSAGEPVQFQADIFVSIA